jgi:8-oxo-dGTP diphosphatase
MDKPRRIGVYKRFVFMPDYDLWAEKICTIYRSRPTLSVGPPLEDGHTAIWVPMRDAPALLSNDGDATFVASLL